MKHQSVAWETLKIVQAEIAEALVRAEAERDEAGWGEDFCWKEGKIEGLEEALQIVGNIDVEGY